MNIAKPACRINAEIGKCLSLCYLSGSPRRDLSEYLKSLFRSSEWTQDEVVVVRSAAARILREIAQPEEADSPPL